MYVCMCISFIQKHLKECSRRRSKENAICFGMVLEQFLRQLLLSKGGKNGKHACNLLLCSGCLHKYLVLLLTCNPVPHLGDEVHYKKYTMCTMGIHSAKQSHVKFNQTERKVESMFKLCQKSNNHNTYKQHQISQKYNNHNVYKHQIR